MAKLAAHVTDHVLPHLPVRQWILSLPKRLRPFLDGNTDIAGAVLRIFIRAVRTTLCGTSPDAPRDAQLGALSFLRPAMRACRARRPRRVGRGGRGSSSMRRSVLVEDTTVPSVANASSCS